MTDLQKALYEVAIDLSLWMETVGTVTSDKPHLYNIGSRLYSSLDELANTCADGPDEDGWIPWHGGEQPVPHHTWVTVMNRERRSITSIAGDFRWYHDGTYGDIVSYRVIEDTTRTEQVQNEQNAPKQGANGYSRDLVEQMYNALLVAKEDLSHDDTPYESRCPACAVEQAIETYEAETKDARGDQNDQE